MLVDICINNLRYADDIGLMGRYFDEMNELLSRVASESEKVGLKSIQRKLN